MIRTSLAAMIMFTLSASSAFAGKCNYTIKREACPGMEAKAIEPYKGKTPTFKEIDAKTHSTTEEKTADTVDACKSIAEKESKIRRKGTLASKVVTATFDGADAGEFKGTAACN